MSKAKLIDQQKLKKLSDNFKNKRSSSTNHVIISLAELEAFIGEAKAMGNVAAIRIQLVRYDLVNPSEKTKKKITAEGDGLSQPSVVLVPMTTFDRVRGGGQDLTSGTQVFALSVSDPDDPEEPEQQEAVLCPPKCG